MRPESLIKHYWDCAGALDSENHVHKLLKSYYTTICRKLAKSSIWMPKEKFSRNTMCRRCSSKWNETNFQMKVNPQQIPYSAKAKKQIEKLYDAKSGIEKRRALTRKQRKRAKWLKKRVMNSVEIQCELCQHKTTIEMHKPNKEERESGTIKNIDLDEIALPKSITFTPATVTTKKKKNKSKDKTAGLKIDKVQIVATKNAASKIDDNKNSINNVKKQEHSIPIAKTQQPNNKNIKADVKTVGKLCQPLKAKKQKKKAKNSTAAAAQKVQSKTQQQNSLLQLAALLKMQNKSSPNATQKRLEFLLK